MSTLIGTSVLASHVVLSEAKESLKFSPKVENVDINIPQDHGFWKLPGGTPAQNSTLVRYQRYLISKGVHDKDLLRRASAILVHENESLTFDRMHDGNLGFGLCGRYVGIPYKKFRELHPEEVTLEAQIQWCGDRFISSMEKFENKTASKSVKMPDGRVIKTTDRDFRVWVYNNCPACAYRGVNTSHLKPQYFQRVQYSYEKLSLL